MARRSSQRQGVLVIDKPAGLTSHDVVARIRRLIGEQRVGHTGTLDPLATGVLPVCVGTATRLVEYLSEANKTYLAVVQLGQQTTTDDREGEVIAEGSVPDLDHAALESVLDGFRGPLDQMPPAYAAIKVGGRKLYELARAGEQIRVPARPVTIHQLTALAWERPALTLRVVCSKGTYIRSLARDIGATLGCGGHLIALRREQVGPFDLTQALTLERLTDEFTPERWSSLALPADQILADRPALHLSEAATIDWLCGRLVPGPPADGGTVARVYATDGRFVGVARPVADGTAWQPIKVLSPGPSGPL